ncbi:MAG TPA: ribosome assembly cofactor RimP [Aminobacterium sp.]|jgi:ribosome maturation factor RimP|uniref:ribosome maturation factor RimP n=1 Tax=Aminobacterium TaxID=81466 RepID=UPI000EE0DF3C|nr:ribosome maturation factor RimP [Aminobacterium sp. UBA4834]HCA40568.1 ribosome assembly cofactor RimP [Aminobacterium sp.]
MTANFDKENLRTSICDIVEKNGYECVGVIFAREAHNFYIRVYIDTLGGITVKDCEIVSKSVSRYLDAHDESIPQRYFLEVGSPGLDRPLFSIEDFEKFIGRKAKVRCQAPVEGRKRFKGEILGVNKDTGSIRLSLEETTQEVDIPWASIQKSNLVYEGD